MFAKARSGADIVSEIEQYGRQVYEDFRPYRVQVPLGESGPWKIWHREIMYDLAYLRFARDGRHPGLGTHTFLSHEERGTIMSDTAAEISDLLIALDKMQGGNVLVSGLGLGMAVHIMTKIPKYSDRVETITVIEKDHDVIKLTGPFYEKSDARVKIIYADAYKWEPPKGVVFDSAWHDIWDTGGWSGREERAQLTRHFRGKVATGQQFVWGRNV